MKLLETLEKTLKKEPNFITDNGELKKWVIIKGLNSVFMIKISAKL